MMGYFFTTYIPIEYDFRDGELSFLVKIGGQVVEYQGLPDVEEIAEATEETEDYIAADSFSFFDLDKEQIWQIFEYFFDRFKIVDYSEWTDYAKVNERLQASYHWVDQFQDMLKKLHR